MCIELTKFNPPKCGNNVEPKAYFLEDKKTKKVTKLYPKNKK